MKTDKEVGIKLGIEALKTMRSGMTLEEAIEELEPLTKDAHNWIVRPALKDALKLGIEALKKWKECRASDQGWWNLLPGETEE